MKGQELRMKTTEDLQRELLDLSREQFKLRMQRSGDQLAKNSELNRVRRDIARIKTILTEKQGG
ncbi:50S ribosomal protein L29 [Candidatus Nitrosoglobus terrae]|uniref:Large ribosomal subunit protein uL29 n=1 Tax=Candidatus Nitrosoglobus terrae TaxID=1630141 RepID=A0A1Q2SLR1_9GAMM|nr:50S ribosomal protein L29 [Candidatus Nitrosoglobus terrae]BAW80037.1 50S ribosomal protein L29 [Candidatus Nitrosoglobus terrae]